MTSTRVRYREGQILRAGDLADEQAYRITMRRRHNIGPHGWGIVAGLAITYERGTFWVEPGMAIDGYGRELIVPERILLPVDKLFESDEIEAVDVWLFYCRAPATPPQEGRWDCGPGEHSRWREEAVIRLNRAGEIDPRYPAEVSEADFDFGPHRTPPDDSERQWPVYLGRIRYALLFHVEDLNDLSGLADKLGNDQDPLYQYLFRELVQLYVEDLINPVELAVKLQESTDPKTEALPEVVVTALNSLIFGRALYDEQQLGIVLQGSSLYYANRVYLESVYQGEIKSLSLYFYDDVRRKLIVLPEGWVERLNLLLAGPSLYNQEYFKDVELRRETRALLRTTDLPNKDIIRLNRLLLEDVFPAELARWPINLTRRPYTSLIGGSITDPAHRARMQVGSELASDRHRFAISLPNESGIFQDQLSIDQKGNAKIQGNTTMEGNLIFNTEEIKTQSAPEQFVDPRCLKSRRPGAIEPDLGLTPGITFEPMAAPPEVEMPWQIYHTIVSEEGETKRQLRIEIGHPLDEEDANRYCLAIGRVGIFDHQATFLPYLIVKPDGTVEIHGKLHVQDGRIIEGPIQPDPDDPRFEQELALGWLEGLTRSSERLDLFYAVDLQVELDPLATVEAGATLSYSFVASNLSPVEPITGIQTTETIKVGDDIVLRQQLLDLELNLSPGVDSGRQVIEYEIPAGQNLAGQLLIIEVRAQGLEAGTVIFVSDKQEAPIGRESLEIVVTPHEDNQVALLGQDFLYIVEVKNTSQVLVNDITLTAEPTVEGIQEFVGEIGAFDQIPAKESSSLEGPVTFQVPIKRSYIGKQLMIAVETQGTKQINNVDRTIRASGETSVLIEAGELALDLDVPDRVVVSEQMSYQVTVSNPSPGDVTDIKLYATLTALNANIPARQQIEFIGLLGGNDEQVIEEEFPNSLLENSIGQNLTIKIEAEGFAQAGTPIKAEITKPEEGDQITIVAGNLQASLVEVPDAIFVEDVINDGQVFTSKLKLENTAPVGNVTIESADAIDVKLSVDEVSIPALITLPPELAFPINLSPETSQEIIVTVDIQENILEENNILLSSFVEEVLIIEATIDWQREGSDDAPEQAKASNSVLIDGGRLAIEDFRITVLPVVGERMRYEVDIVNIGDADVKNIVVKEIITIGDDAPLPASPIGSVTTLTPGTSKTFSGTVDIPADYELQAEDEVTVLLRITGTGKAGTKLPALPETDLTRSARIGLLKVEPLLPTTITASETIGYTVRVTNSGDEEVTGITLNVFLTIGPPPDTPVPPATHEISIDSLTAFTVKDFEGPDYTVPDNVGGQRLTMTVTVMQNNIEFGEPISTSRIIASE